MSEIFTAICLSGTGFAGLAERDRKTVPEMIAAYRAYALRLKAEADAVLSAEDADFYVSAFRGIHVQRDRQVLQEGREREVQP